MQIPVKAAAGALVRHPHTREALPRDGDDSQPVLVDETDLHWARLLRDGDLVRIKPAPSGRSSRKDEQA